MHHSEVNTCIHHSNTTLKQQAICTFRDIFYARVFLKNFDLKTIPLFIIIIWRSLLLHAGYSLVVARGLLIEVISLVEALGL